MTGDQGGQRGFGQSGADRRSIGERCDGLLVDVTADWCITCAANEALVLNTDDIQQAFADSNVEYLVADWTRYDPAITALLAEFERNGIPLYVYYPADMSAAPQILPQVLNKTMVLRVLNTP